MADETFWMGPSTIAARPETDDALAQLAHRLYRLCFSMV